MIRGAESTKERLGRTAYVLSGASNLNATPFEARIKVDGAPWYEGPASCILLGFEGQYATTGKTELHILAGRLRQRIERIRGAVRDTDGGAPGGQRPEVQPLPHDGAVRADAGCPAVGA